MNLIKTTMMTAALVFGGTQMAFAQDSMTDKAKEMAVDKGTKMVKDKAMDAVGHDKSKYVDPAAKMGENMLKGDTAKDAAMKAVSSDAKSMGKSAVMGDMSTGGLTDTSMSAGEAMTAGKVIMKGGSKEDAVMAVAKDRAKDKMMDTAKGMMTVKTPAPTEGPGQMMTSGDVQTPAVAPVTVTAPAAMPVNCPAGTTAQADGSCMITGDYKG